VLDADDTFGLAAGRKAMEIGEQQHRSIYLFSNSELHFGASK
jgi:hypothetical protein